MCCNGQSGVVSINGVRNSPITAHAGCDIIHSYGCSIKQKYGAIRLEAACSRANHYGSPHYTAVKTILQKGLDQLTLLNAFDALASTYTEGGRFCRNTQTILQ